MAEDEVLMVEGLTLSFGGLSVLEDISFAVGENELFALIGPNGAGKTSVMNCISGIYRPSRGVVRFQGHDITGLSPHKVAAGGIARTFQHGELFAHMTVIENLMVGRHSRFRSGVIMDGLFWGRTRKQEIEQREHIERVIEFVELERYRKTSVAALPFGLQKVVGFARALAMEPALMLLDEPSAGLNREEKEDLARFVLRIKHELGIPMIWVEHDMQMIADLADRVYVMNYGRFVAEGPPEKVLNDQNVIDIYLGGSQNGRRVAT